MMVKLVTSNKTEIYENDDDDDNDDYNNSNNNTYNNTTNNNYIFLGRISQLNAPKNN